MKMMLRVLMICAFAIPASAVAHDTPKIGADAGVQVYSDMGFIQDEGEYSGLQIILIPYNPHYGSFKEKIVWRSGSGNLETPLLLDGVRDGKNIEVSIPEENSEHGKWVLTMNANSLSARGPHGLHHELTRIFFK